MSLVPDEGEFNFARSLVNPDKEVRDNTLRALHNYVSSVKEMEEMQMLKLWKALYYCMWLSDKQDIQKELANSLCNMVDIFQRQDLSLLFVQMFFKTVLREWCHLDQYRVNKFYSLIRLFVNKSLSIAFQNKWSHEITQKLLNIIDSEILTKKPNGIRYHVADIYLTELVNVSKGVVEPSVFVQLMEVFVACLVRVDDSSFVERVSKSVFQQFVAEFAAENKDNEEITHALFSQSATRALQKLLFDTAAAESTPDFARKRLYALHKELAGKSGIAFISEEGLGVVEGFVQWPGEGGQEEQSYC